MCLCVFDKHPQREFQMPVGEIIIRTLIMYVNGSLSVRFFFFFFFLRVIAIWGHPVIYLLLFKL